MTKKRQLRIITWNANSVRNKMEELKIFLNRESPDIMTITETKLQPTDKLKLNNYSIVRRDRENEYGGGVMILIKKGIPFRTRKIPTTTIEAAAVDLPRNNITIVGAYNRPKNYYKGRDLTRVLNISKRVVLAGDLNSKHKDWGNPNANTNGQTLKKTLEDAELLINFPDEPTHYPTNGGNPTTIDGFIHKSNTGYTKAKTINDLNSDHLPVETQSSTISSWKT